MSPTTELVAETELIDLQLYPSEPVSGTDLLVDERDLPYSLVGAEPEPALLRVVERFGFPQRILAVPATDEADGEYRVLDQASWVRAAREAGVDRIPVRVLDLRGPAADLLTLILNQQRVANVAAQVDALERLLEAGISEGELARASGLSKAKIHRLASLIQLEPELRQALRDDRIKAPVAFSAAELAGDVQAELAATLEREGQLTATQVKQVRERMGTGGSGPVEPTEAADHQALHQLLAKAGLNGEEPVARVHRQASELLRSLDEADIGSELRSRLVGLLEEIQQASA